MNSINPNYPAPVKKDRRHLALSREYPAQELGVSYATVNRWEKVQARPSKLGKAQFDSFCSKMVRQGKLKLSGGDK
ncbi:MAG: hypothetical protein L6300_00155 [Syntrophaceae bacterium]|nr:hypothetical protein [Syntrophaceae bacterium]